MKTLNCPLELLTLSSEKTSTGDDISSNYNLPGSSPGGSRVIRRWGRSRRPGKNIFNYRYRGRLETDSVVGELVEKRG